MIITAGDIVERTGELFSAVGELLTATSDLGLPQLAAELGVATTAAELTRGLVEVLESIAPQLEVLINLGRLGALFGMIEPLVSGLQGLFVDSGRNLSALGLGDALTITTPIATGFGYLEATAALGATLIIDPGQLDELRDGLAETTVALETLAEQFETAAASAA
ncbi:MAG: hypothetical protein AB1Z98_17830 [Nannocystaceae bacterium]